ncbi:MAG: segregation/condensation protein A, partial [Candidatus Dormiibacterota bacterium]
MEQAPGPATEATGDAAAGRVEPLSQRPRIAITVPVFEGPMELLLALAERDEIDLFEVRLGDVTEAYLQAIGELTQPDPVEMAEFLWLAARLLLLKSIRLLPGDEPEPEEVELLGWEEDVRRRLQEYRHVKAVAEALMARQEEDQRSFPPPAREVEAVGQEEPLDVSALVIAFQSLLERLPPRPLVVVGNAWTLEDKVDFVQRRLTKGAFDLGELILECEDRLEAVVTFVAL